MIPLPSPRAHLDAAVRAVAGLDRQLGLLERLGTQLCDVTAAGGRLLACGNGGSAAQAQHLTAELVGRYRDDRRPLSALALHADTSAVTAITNDYGPDEVFARQVLAHGRPGDVLLALSTSGRSPNVVRAVQAARAAGLRCWAFTGPAPNPLAEEAHEALVIPAEATAAVQEAHQVAVHLLCLALEHRLRDVEAGTPTVVRVAS